MSSVISSITNLYSTTSTSKITNETVNSVAETDEEQSTSTSTKYDTLELSQDYLDYKTESESSTVSDDTNPFNSTMGEMPPPPPPSTDDSEDDDESESDLLSILTENDDISEATEELQPPPSPEMTSGESTLGEGTSDESNSGNTTL